MAKPNGAIIWQGESLLDNAPIMVVAIGLSVRSKKKSNRKTGAMIQTYIIRSDISPLQAVHSGADVSICGSCIHRGDAGKKRTCFVNLWHGPTVVYKHFRKGGYALADDLAELGRDRMVRLGTYGDPAAVPVHVWQSLTRHALGHTGYTHQWRNIDAATWAPLVMASADDERDARHAQELGYRTFRVTTKNARMNSREVLCPASREAGAKIQCEQCRACNGTASARKGSIYIPLHGGIAIMANAKHFESRIIARQAA